MANQKSKPVIRRGRAQGVIVRPLSERLNYARQIDEFRQAHKGMRIEEVFKEMGLAEKGITASNYWAWRKRLELAEATRKANRAHAEPDTQHFPLDVIPTKPKAAPRGVPVANAKRTQDEDRALAAELLAIVTRLLRR